MSFEDDCNDSTADVTPSRIVGYAIASELRDLIAEAQAVLAKVESGALPEAYEGLGLELKAFQCKRLIRAQQHARALATRAATPTEDQAANAAMRGYGHQVERSLQRSA